MSFEEPAGGATKAYAFLGLPAVPIDPSCLRSVAHAVAKVANEHGPDSVWITRRTCEPFKPKKSRPVVGFVAKRIRPG